MTVSDPSSALQAGIYALLTGDAELTGLAGVFDEVPEDHGGDYVVIGPRKTSIPDDVHGSHGRENVLTVDIWTRARSSIPGDRIGGRIVELLSHQHQTLDPLVAGHTVWRIRWESSQSVDDPERELRRRTDQFRISTAQED